MSLIMLPFEPFVSPAAYSQLSLILSSIGLLLMAIFFMMEVTNRGKSEYASLVEKISRLIKEITIAFAASFFLGFGLLFLCLDVGIYV